jgi:hypothetical protein
LERGLENPLRLHYKVTDCKTNNSVNIPRADCKANNSAKHIKGLISQIYTLGKLQNKQFYWLSLSPQLISIFVADSFGGLPIEFTLGCYCDTMLTIAGASPFMEYYLIVVWFQHLTLK